MSERASESKRMSRAEYLRIPRKEELNMNSLIMQAVTGKHLIQLSYPPGLRIVEPHAYGVDAHGNELLRAFQVSGVSASGEPSDWKLFRVDRIISLTMLPEFFEDARPGYRRGDSAITKEIYVEL